MKPTVPCFHLSSSINHVYLEYNNAPFCQHPCIGHPPLWLPHCNKPPRSRGMDNSCHQCVEIKTATDYSLSAQKCIYITFSSQLILFHAVENARPWDSIFCTAFFLTATWCLKNSESSLIFSCVSAHFLNTDGATRKSVKNALESFGLCHFFKWEK